MYFLFSTLFGFIISPLNWIVVLTLIALLSKKPKRKKRALLSAVILLMLFSNNFLFTLYARIWNIDQAPLEKGKVYSAAIVLGGFISEDANGRGFFNEHSDRFLETIRLKSTGQVSHIMVSGGNRSPDPSGFTESGFVKTVLRELNFPDSVILTEG